MKRFKNITVLALSVFAFYFLVNCGSNADNKKDMACKEKGMILIQGRGRDYCTIGDREGL